MSLLKRNYHLGVLFKKSLELNFNLSTKDCFKWIENFTLKHKKQYLI